MLQVHPVESLDLPELAPYRTMRRQEQHRQEDIFVAEGEKVVRRLLESDLEMLSLLLPEKWFEAYRELLARRPEKGLKIFTAERKLLERLTGFSMYQGVLAVARVPKPVLLEELIQRTTRPLLLLAVEGISSAENLGGLVRSCAAFGASALVVGETCCSPWLRRSVRSSMGTIFKLPILETPNLRETLLQAKKSAVRIIAAHPHTDQFSLPKADLRGDVLITFGSEGAGLTTEVLEICDQRIVIPMASGIDSLNVGTAGAIFLYEASSQRAGA